MNKSIRLFFLTHGESIEDVYGRIQKYSDIYKNMDR